MRTEVEDNVTKRESLLPSLEEKLASCIKTARQEGKKLLAEHGDSKLSDVTVKQAYGGMRGVKCMVTETSSVDPMEGIRYRGYPIPEMREKLPKVAGGEEPLPEGVYHLLLTGEIPTEADVKELADDLRFIFIFPVLHMADEFVTFKIGSAFTLFSQQSFLDYRLRCDPCMVGARHPQRIVLLHSSKADQNIL